MSAASDMMRKMCKESDDKRDAGLTTPKDIERFDDIVYGEDEEWNVLDVYKPKQETPGRIFRSLSVCTVEAGYTEIRRDTSITA